MSEIKLILGDCLQEMKKIPDKSIDLVLTDPPYPDYYKEEYQYKEGLLNFLNKLSCRQFIFWTSKDNFPLSYTAIHIWDKKSGAGSQYERIFERNGQHNYNVYRYYLINSTVAANFTRDIFTGHPSQKPIKLIKEIVNKFTKEGDTIFDPFAGSFTTAVACKELHRKCIAIEINKEYYEIGKRRLDNTIEPML